ncbi:hypothetical protein GGS20DRAFT_165619 [Poronia punctata]|nr:hypothetical protein GGS20DRAFT_165619 [Poronia punctata]
MGASISLVLYLPSIYTLVEYTHTPPPFLTTSSHTTASAAISSQVASFPSTARRVQNRFLFVPRHYCSHHYPRPSCFLRQTSKMDQANNTGPKRSKIYRYSYFYSTVAGARVHVVHGLQIGRARDRARGQSDREIDKEQWVSRTQLRYNKGRSSQLAMTFPPVSSGESFLSCPVPHYVNASFPFSLFNDFRFHLYFILLSLTLLKLPTSFSSFEFTRAFTTKEVVEELAGCSHKRVFQQHATCATPFFGCFGVSQTFSSGLFSLFSFYSSHTPQSEIHSRVPGSHVTYHMSGYLIPRYREVSS